MNYYEFSGKPINEKAMEAYITLRTNLRFYWGGSIKTITVSSCLPGEGKSQVSLNLAITLANTGQKVLLMDADMRKARKNEKELDKKEGLSYLLSGPASIEGAICSTNYENLHYLSSGCLPPNPAELVSSKSFSELLEFLIENLNYNKVIIDTPSIGSFIDGAAIAAQTDGIILVVKCSHTKAKALRQTKEQLDMLNVKVLGVVLNLMKKNDYKEQTTFDKYHRYYAKAKKTFND